MGEIGKREQLPHSSLHVWMDVCEKLKPTMFASWLLFFLRNFCSEWDWKQSNKKYLFHNITMGIISVFFQKTSIKISVTMWGEGAMCWQIRILNENAKLFFSFQLLCKSLHLQSVLSLFRLINPPLFESPSSKSFLLLLREHKAVFSLCS